MLKKMSITVIFVRVQEGAEVTFAFSPLFHQKLGPSLIAALFTYRLISSMNLLTTTSVPGIYE